MPDAPSVTRPERFAPWIAGALIALPVLIARYPPMADLPLHEAIVGLLRHWGDPKLTPPTVYELNLGLANQLFYFLILGFSYVVSVSTATKLVVAIALFVLPVAAGRLADYVGVTRWAAVLITPIGLGWMFFWGLLSNLLGLDVFLLALPFFDRFCLQPTPRRLAAVCAWVTLLHFTHDMMALTSGGTLILLTVCSWRGWRENVARFVPSALVIALALSSRIIAARITNKYHSALPDWDWYTPWHKLITIPGVLYAGYEWWVRLLIFVACNVPLVLFAIERAKNGTPKARTRREWLHDFRFEILGASLMVSYFAAPLNMKGTTLIYHRFCPPAWIILTIAACTREHLAHPWRLPRLLAAFVPLAPLLTSWERFVDSDRSYKDLDAAIAHMEPGSTYAVLELGGPTSGYSNLYSPITGGGHIVAVLGGRGFFDFTHSEASPVYQRLDKQWSTIFTRMDGHSYRMMPSYDLTHFRYAILHSTDLNVARVAVFAIDPDAREIFHQGEWTVMESTLPLVPIDAPDEPTPTPHPKSLRKRCLEVIERIKNMPADEQALPPDDFVPTAPRPP